jgi:sugar lactone lactonase YvrE
MAKNALTKSTNPLLNWRIDPKDIRTIGKDLRRPECILAERDGTLWSADARGGVMRIAADGQQTFIGQSMDNFFDVDVDAKRSLLRGTLPNGLAFAPNGDILIANFGTDALEIMTRDGHSRTLYDSIDGKPLGKVNFVLRDAKNRIWVTVSTKINPWDQAMCSAQADGYVALIDEKGMRVVADGFVFANEIRLDDKEEWLYVAETCARRVTRLRVLPNGTLSDREIYGPSSLGPGAIDGIAFDAFGNLWATMIFADRLVAITPEGDLLTLLDDGDPHTTARFDDALSSGRPVDFGIMAAAGGTIAPWLASITFGGPDLQSVYLGSLKGTTIPYFRSPVPGLPMVHW